MNRLEVLKHLVGSPLSPPNIMRKPSEKKRRLMIQTNVLVNIITRPPGKVMLLSKMMALSI